MLDETKEVDLREGVIADEPVAIVPIDKAGGIGGQPSAVLGRVVPLSKVDEAGIGIDSLGGKTPGVVGGRLLFTKSCICIVFYDSTIKGYESGGIAEEVVDDDEWLSFELDPGGCSSFRGGCRVEDAELVVGADLFLVVVDEELVFFSDAPIVGVVSVRDVVGGDEAVQGIVSIGVGVMLELSTGETVMVGVVGVNGGVGDFVVHVVRRNDEARCRGKPA